MRLAILSGILLAAAVWVAVSMREGGVVKSGGGTEVTQSDRRRGMVFEGPRSAREFIANLSNSGFARRSDFDRVRSAVREFGEEELLEMVAAEDWGNDQAALWRLAAMWERLGELESEVAIDLLVERSGGGLAVINFGVGTRWDHAAHAFVVGWAGSLKSLEEIQEELLPHLLKFKRAGFQRHELALGREMARFDLMAAWNILAGPQEPESPLTGSDCSLRGLVKGAAGKSELNELLPFIQQRPQRLRSLSVSVGQEVARPNLSSTSASFDRDGSILSLEGQGFNSGDDLNVVNSGMIELVESDRPDLFSQAVGALMVSSPEVAREYLTKGKSFHSYHAQQADGEEVWKTMAELDPEAAFELLTDPEFEDFSPGIAKGLVASEPRRVGEVLPLFPEADEQINLIREAVSQAMFRSPLAEYPTDPGNSRWVDSEDRQIAIDEAIDEAIENSAISAEKRQDLRDRFGFEKATVDELFQSVTHQRLLLNLPPVPKHPHLPVLPVEGGEE